MQYLLDPHDKKLVNCLDLEQVKLEEHVIFAMVDSKQELVELDLAAMLATIDYFY